MVKVKRSMALPASVWWAGAAFAALLGFSRISFGLLLPFIRHEYPASYTVYGAVASANFAGYLAGLLGTALLPLRFHDRRSNTVALWIVAITLALCAIAPNLATVALARFVNGVAQAVATMLTIGLTLAMVPPAQRGRASGILWGGGGAGIALCALALPYVSSVAPGWRIVWFAMAIATAGIVVGLQRVLPARVETPAGALGTGATDRIAIAILCMEYLFFGAGFAVYFTYAPAFAHQIVRSPNAFAIAWIITGLAGAFGGGLWGSALDHSRRGVTLAISLVLGAAGISALLIPNLAAAVFSAILVGGCTFGIPAQTTALVRRFSEANGYVIALTIVTAAFAIGQTIGAPIGGWLADAFGLSSAIAASAGIFTVGGLIALAIAVRGPG